MMSREQIVEKLKSLVVCEGGEKPYHTFSFIVENPDYDPEGFVQEIEDSEEKIDEVQAIFDEMNKPDFDYVFNNTLESIKTNSDLWKANHRKICKYEMKWFVFNWQCVNHLDGTRDYYCEEYVDKIMEFGKQYGGIVDM